MRSLHLLTLAALVAFPLVGQTPASVPAPDQGGVGDLLVAPTRVILENGQKVGEVVVSNTGDTPGTYRISLLRMAMQPDGSLKEVSAPPAGELDPVSLFRYSPHEVLLQPGETQVVRIAARKPADLPDGEYRVHIQFMGLPKVSAPKAKAAMPTKGFSARIEPVFAVAIPLVLIQGKVSATAGISGLSFQPGTKMDRPTLRFHLDRQGTGSLYGDLKVFFTPSDGVPHPVGEMDGVGVYTNLAARPIALTLDAPQGVTFRHGLFTVSFVDEKGKTTLATATLGVP
ncbi:MAG: molecular chaperone [Acidobacteria bacterium]|nr:molecular chaperone [Acidobacteriota bacterium]